jgi:hypothetical protein
MKPALKISIAANILLAALVLWLARQAQNGAPGNAAIARPDIDPAPAPAAQSQSVSAAAQPQPEKKFQWKQLESADYRAYIANLKAVGCPQQTIRDIIMADVDNLYAPRRQQLAAQVPAGPPTLRANALQMLGSKLDALNREELSVLSSLLGAPPGPDQQSLAADPPARVQRDQSQDDASLPLVFQNVDPAALKLSEDQVNDLAFLRQKFQEDVGSPGQNPNDPAYLKRWQTALSQNDQMLRAMLGSQIYDQFQSEADSHPAPPQ